MRLWPRFLTLSLIIICTVPAAINRSRAGAILNFSLKDIAPAAGVAGEPTFGRAAAWGDYDQDGKVDLFVCSSMGPEYLYHNNGDGTFTDVAREMGFPQVQEPMFGAIWIDYDNDGDLDLYLAIGAEIEEQSKTAAENRLLRNDVNTIGRFVDVTEEANAGGGKFRSWGACWADYDNDGFLDVFISNTKDPNVLLRNRGDGTFEDVSQTAGLVLVHDSRFALWLDYNLDGWMDIFVVNVNEPEELFRNNGDGTFTDVAEEAGIVDVSPYSWVASTEDFNHDGWPDIILVSWNKGPSRGRAALFMNQRDGTFAEKAEEMEIAPILRNMSVQTADLNNDGNMDVLMGNGGPSAPEPNSLFLDVYDPRTGVLRFEDVSDECGLTSVMEGRSHGIAAADWDDDGDLDVYINDGGPASKPTSKEVKHFFLNEGGNANHWIKLRLEGTRSNRDAVGARVMIVTPGFTQHLFVKGGSGFSSSSDRQVHFGIGAATEATSIEIHWPSGAVQTLRNIPAGARLKVMEPGPQTNWHRPSQATALEIQRAEAANRPRGTFTITCACCVSEAR